MKDIDQVLAALSKSTFRRRFSLTERDRAYIATKGTAAVLDHARGFVALRLAPANPSRDGKQTPFRGHPVFIAQHATATCCRGCLAKWHKIPSGRELLESEQAYIVAVIGKWLEGQNIDGNNPQEPRLL